MKHAEKGKHTLSGRNPMFRTATEMPAAFHSGNVTMGEWPWNTEEGSQQNSFYGTHRTHSWLLSLLTVTQQIKTLGSHDLLRTAGSSSATLRNFRWPTANAYLRFSIAANCSVCRAFVRSTKPLNFHTQVLIQKLFPNYSHQKTVAQHLVEGSFTMEADYHSMWDTHSHDQLGSAVLHRHCVLDPVGECKAVIHRKRHQS